MPSTTTPAPTAPRDPSGDPSRRGRHRSTLIELVRTIVLLAQWFLPETLIADVAHWFDELVRSMPPGA